MTQPQEPQQRGHRHSGGVTVDATLASDIDAACRLTRTFVLRSGHVSDEYFDKCLFKAQPTLLDQVTTAMVELLPEGTQLLGGLELGGVPIATMISARTACPHYSCARRPKSTGTAKLAEGPDVTGRRVTLIEDVTTTGCDVRDAAALT